MWKPIKAPGEWLVFLTRKDNKNLPIMEARKKYMQEQLLFEAYENNLNTVNTVNTTTSAPAAAAAGGGGLRKFKYAAQYELFTVEGKPQSKGIYDRIAISDLKQYWYDNFFNSRDGAFYIPPPSIPSNIGSDFFFIKKEAPDPGSNGAAQLITWGTLGRGRQIGQWTYSEYRTPPLRQPVDDCYRDLGLYDKWNTFGFGSTSLNTPAGKWSINDVVGSGIKGGSCSLQRNPYELVEVRPTPPPKGALVVTGETSSDTTYIGNYVKDPNSGDGQSARYVREDNSYVVYYSTNCAMWRIDSTGVGKLDCGLFTGNPTGDDPKGVYQLTVIKSPQTGTYTVSGKPSKAGS